MRTNWLVDMIPDHIYYAKSSKTSLYCPYTTREGGYHKFIYSQNNICGGPLSYHDTKIEIIYIPKFGELIINYDNIFKNTIHIKSIYKYNNDVKFECDLNKNKYTLTDDDFIQSLNNFKMNFKQMLNEMKNKLNNIK